MVRARSDETELQQKRLVANLSNMTTGRYSLGTRLLHLSQAVGDAPKLQRGSEVYTAYRRISLHNVTSLLYIYVVSSSSSLLGHWGSVGFIHASDVTSMQPSHEDSQAATEEPDSH